LLRPVGLAAFLLLAISSNGCFFGRPCAPGNWQYHSLDGQYAGGPAQCQTCTTPLIPNDPNKSESGVDRPRISPTPEKIPPLPSPPAGARQETRPRAQVAQWQGQEPHRPTVATKTGPQPGSTENTTPSDVQECDWQSPDNILWQSPSAKTDGKPAPNTQPPGPHRQPSAGETLTMKPQQVPFSWGYFGASVR